MKTLKWILPAALFFTLLISCGKEDTGWQGPIPGKVVHTGSGTPVPFALVRFIRYGSTAENWEQEIGRDTTDINGNFIIPAQLEPDAAIAWGRSDMYNSPSEEAPVVREGPITLPIELRLIPPAWARVRSEDEEPLNPEVDQVVINAAPGDFPPDETPLTGPIILRTLGNIPFELNYRLYINGESMPWQKISRDGLAEFDTTDIVITY